MIKDTKEIAKKGFHRFADLLGICGATLCMLHCFFMPILLSLFSVFGIAYLSYAFLFVSFLSVFEASKQCSNTKILSFIWACFWLLCFSTLFEDDFKHLHELSYVASLGLIIGHILNINYCKKCQK